MQVQKRPVFLVKFRPEKGDGLKSLRAILKFALRRHGVRCLEAVEIREEPEKPPELFFGDE
jgi:hypothetical protein